MAQEPGFELILPGDEEATFFPYSVAGTTTAKGMKIIDGCTQLPLDEFDEAYSDPRQRMRGPMMLAMLGLSILNSKPTWSAERIMVVVDNADLAEIGFVGGDEEQPADDDPLPGSESDETGESPSVSPSDEPAPPLTPPEPSTTEPSSDSSSTTPE